MIQMTNDAASTILKQHKQVWHFNARQAMAWVTRTTGKTALQQTREFAGLALGRQKLTVEDYYLYGIWRPTLTAAERAAFLSDRAGAALNKRLSPVNRSGLHGLIDDKLLLGLVLRAAGFPSQVPRAIYGKVTALPGVTRLTTADEIAGWLRRDGTLPVFGKPLHASLGIGAASILALSGDGRTVDLGNGATVAVDALATEIAASFERGYLFEPLIRQHPDVAAVTGPAMGGLRVVTLMLPGGPELLYTVQRLPAAGAMIDGGASAKPNSVAHIDPATGRVIRVQNMHAMATAGLETALVTGVRFDAVVLPFVAEAVAVAIEVHRLLARAGVLGFDIALTGEGPIINEVNATPFHSTYQRGADRGLLNPEFKPRIDAAVALAAAGGAGKG